MSKASTLYGLCLPRDGQYLVCPNNPMCSTRYAKEETTALKTHIAILQMDTPEVQAFFEMIGHLLERRVQPFVSPAFAYSGIFWADC